MKPPMVELVGTGRYNPKKVLSNADLELMVDTSDQWIVERTGIRERRIASDEETVAAMAKVACEQVLEDVGIGIDDVDMIIAASVSPDHLLPSQACDIQAALGATHATAFDVVAACSGFIYALTVAQAMVLSGSATNVLVVGGERLSTITNYKDRSTCILFGDGVGATLVRATSADRGILTSYLKTDGSFSQILCRPGGGGVAPFSEQVLADRSQYLAMAGREVFKKGVLSMADACKQVLDRAGLTADDIDILIPHQANLRIIEATAKHAGIPLEKVYSNIDRFGNTSAASIPIALDECVRSGRIKEGSLVLMVAFGGGLTWGSMIVKW